MSDDIRKRFFDLKLVHDGAPQALGPCSRAVESATVRGEAMIPTREIAGFCLALILAICGAAALLHWALTSNVVA